MFKIALPCVESRIFDHGKIGIILILFYENARYTFYLEFIPEYQLLVYDDMCTRMTPIGLINASICMPLGLAALDSA